MVGAHRQVVQEREGASRGRGAVLSSRAALAAEEKVKKKTMTEEDSQASRELAMNVDSRK